MHVRFSSVRCSFRLCTGNNHGTLPLFPVHLLGGSGCSWRGNCTSNITFEACRKCNGSSVMRVPFIRIQHTVWRARSLPEYVARMRSEITARCFCVPRACSNHCVHKSLLFKSLCTQHDPSRPLVLYTWSVRNAVHAANQSRVPSQTLVPRHKPVTC